MDDAERDLMRKVHYAWTPEDSDWTPEDSDGAEYCVDCGAPWPCLPIKALDALEQSDSELRRLYWLHRDWWHLGHTCPEENWVVCAETSPPRSEADLVLENPSLDVIDRVAAAIYLTQNQWKRNNDDRWAWERARTSDREDAIYLAKAALAELAEAVNDEKKEGNLS